jgi:hypothetical protein
MLTVRRSPLTHDAGTLINVLVQNLTLDQLEAGLADIRQSPKHEGKLVLIVRRPKTDERETLAEAELDLAEGLVGDDWKRRGSSRTPDGKAHPELQLTLINSRAIAVVAQAQDRWGLAGDQLYVDLDLSVENLPVGAKLAIGSAVIEITPYPHTGCRKFAARYGADAVQFVNSAVGKELRLRGVNARVVRPGKIRVGDLVRREP